MLSCYIQRLILECSKDIIFDTRDNLIELNKKEKLDGFMSEKYDVAIAHQYLFFFISISKKVYLFYDESPRCMTSGLWKPTVTYLSDVCDIYVICMIY